MVETVLVLPVLLVVIVLTFFLSSALVRLGHASNLARYEADRLAHDAVGFSSDDTRNATFFGGNAVDIDVATTSRFPDYVLDVHANAVNQVDPNAVPFFEALVDDLPLGVEVRTTVTHEEGGLWARFNRPVTGGHVRLDQPWAYAYRLREDTSIDAWVYETPPYLQTQEVVRDVYLTEMGDLLDAFAGGNPWAEMLRRMMEEPLEYRGPAFPAQ